ncbi:MAG TPA: hypothetical protein VIE65_15310 [Methylobacter sp.]|jgi:hypothetical protein
MKIQYDFLKLGQLPVFNSYWASGACHPLNVEAVSIWMPSQRVWKRQGSPRKSGHVRVPIEYCKLKNFPKILNARLRKLDAQDHNGGIITVIVQNYIPENKYFLFGLIYDERNLFRHMLPPVPEGLPSEI